MTLLAEELRSERRDTFRDHEATCNQLRQEFREFRHDVLEDVQSSSHAVNITTSNLLLHMIQETEQITREVRSMLNNLRHYYELMA